jgi:Protein of unknown function (DUF3500)
MALSISSKWTVQPLPNSSSMEGVASSAFSMMSKGGRPSSRAEEIKLHLLETWFAWMGGFGENNVFYKVYSPVLLIEFGMHKRVFLSNDEPEKFHIHIIVRTPNGNHYR